MNIWQQTDITTISQSSSDQCMWAGSMDWLAHDEAAIYRCLLNLEQPCFAVRTENGIGFATQGCVWPSSHAAEFAGAPSYPLIAIAPALTPPQLGDPAYCTAHRVAAPYMAGAMANGIASVRLVIALGRAKLLSSFGSAGLALDQIEEAIDSIQQALPNGPYAFNLIHSPNDPDYERRLVDLYLRRGVSTIEASAYIELTPQLIYYRVAGLSQNRQGQIEIANKIIAKVSRREVAEQFLQPPPRALIGQFVRAGLLTTTQANLAQFVPVADDITAEADSGGHTDNQPLVCLLPEIIMLRDKLQAHHGYAQPVRVGAGGGIGTPSAALAAYTLGAAYIVTGSINQACVEAGTSEHTKRLLAQATSTDMMMAPSGDMFEQGIKVQLLKKGTLYPMQAQKLYDIYRQYDTIEAIPSTERERIERQVFKKSIEAVWQETLDYFTNRNPDQVQRALDQPKRKMALIFRWYLGLSSRWANRGEPGREMDYQIWCGPAMGAFNDWVRGTYLEPPERRNVVDVARHLMRGAALIYRTQYLGLQGVRLSAKLSRYHPAQPTGNGEQ